MGRWRLVIFFCPNKRGRSHKCCSVPKTGNQSRSSFACVAHGVEWAVADADAEIIRSHSEPAQRDLDRRPDHRKCEGFFSQRGFVMLIQKSFRSRNHHRRRTARRRAGNGLGNGDGERYGASGNERNEEQTRTGEEPNERNGNRRWEKLSKRDVHEKFHRLPLYFFDRFLGMRTYPGKLIAQSLQR